MQNDNLTSTIKQYEKAYENRIEYEKYLLVRIDGHKFSKFTKKFNKPYDYLLSVAMENTTKDLVDKFGASLGFTQSDEITLVFPPSFIEKDGEIINNQIFGGRTQKMASLISAYTSTRFNYWLETEFKFNVYSKIEFCEEKSNTEYNAMVMRNFGTAYFDARVFGVPTKEDAFLTVMWRYLDTIKNSKSMFAQAYCSHKSLLNKSGNEQIALCLSQTGNDWYTVDKRYRFGIFVKKEKYLKPVDNDFSEDNDLVERSRISTFIKDSFELSDENIAFVIDKFI